MLACKTPAKTNLDPVVVRAAPVVPLQAARSAARGRREAHLQLLLGNRRARHRARARSLAATALLEHRGGGLRAQCLCHRRGARLRHARAGARARADHAAVPARRAAGHRSREQAPATRDSSITSSISAPASATAIPNYLPSIPRCSWPACCSSAAISTRTNADEARDPQARRRAVPARELALVDRARARHPHGVEPGRAVRPPRLARLQRGHAGVHPRARLAHFPGRAPAPGWPGRPTTTAAGARSKGRRT